jgi:hypothetical protein
MSSLYLFKGIVSQDMSSKDDPNGKSKIVALGSSFPF